MNKQRYLAELQRLLVFMTPEDCAETIRRYAALFDAAGPGGEAALIEQIGSPTKAAIGLSRGYEPGRLSDRLPGEPASFPQETPPPPKEGELWDELPSLDLPDFEEDVIPGEAPDQQEPERRFSMPELPEHPETNNTPAGGSYVERSMPLGLGIPLFVLVILGLGVPLAALLIGVAAALLIPGCAAFFAAWLTAVGGLWCVGYIADAILLFGAAFVVLAMGIILLFGGVWLDGRLISLYARGLRWVAGELLGRRVAS